MILPRLQGCNNLTNKVNLIEIGKVCEEGHQETLQNTHPCVSVSAWCWCSWASGTHRPFTRLISRSEKGYGSLQVGVRKCATARSGDGNDEACLCKKLKTLPLYTSYVNDKHYSPIESNKLHTAGSNTLKKCLDGWFVVVFQLIGHTMWSCRCLPTAPISRISGIPSRFIKFLDPTPESNNKWGEPTTPAQSITCPRMR